MFPHPHETCKPNQPTPTASHSQAPHNQFISAALSAVHTHHPHQAPQTQQPISSAQSKILSLLGISQTQPAHSVFSHSQVPQPTHLKSLHHHHPSTQHQYHPTSSPLLLGTLMQPTPVLCVCPCSPTVLQVPPSPSQLPQWCLRTGYPGHGGAISTVPGLPVQGSSPCAATGLGHGVVGGEVAMPPCPYILHWVPEHIPAEPLQIPLTTAAQPNLNARWHQAVISLPEPWIWHCHQCPQSCPAPEDPAQGCLCHQDCHGLCFVPSGAGESGKSTIVKQMK